MSTEPTGRDLARLALQQARANAKNTPARRTGTPRRRSAPARGAGRDPIGLGAVVAALMADEGADTALGGGTVLDQWAEIAPELAGKVAAEAFDAATGLLSLRPATAAYGAQMRLFQTQMVVRINTNLGRPVVRDLRVLPPRSPTHHNIPTAGARIPEMPEQLGPVRTRDQASSGYHRALTAHQAAWVRQEDPLPPAVQAAIAEQDEALRRRRESPQDFADARELIEQLQARARAAEDYHSRALARARADKVGRGPAVPRVFDQAG